MNYSDKIIINNLKVFANHGVFDFEKQNGQEFVFSCEIFTDLQCSGLSDSLKDTVNYAAVCEIIKKIATENCFDLLETLAERICMEIFSQYNDAEAIYLTVLKTQAPIDIEHESVGVCIYRKRHTAYLSLGSNIGDCDKHLDDAIKSLNSKAHTKVTKVSSYIGTKPYGYEEQPDFVNCAVEIKTILNPFELLKFTSSIENEHGRTREIHWGPRTLDIDIILYDDEIINEQNLTIPHIEMHKRAFVLEPLCEIAPYRIHPIFKKSILEMTSFDDDFGD